MAKIKHKVLYIVDHSWPDPFATESASTNKAAAKRELKDAKHEFPTLRWRLYRVEFYMEECKEC